MADFDQFTSSEPPPLEEDPAADFLAREQDQLAQLDDGFDDGFGVTTENNKEQGDFFGQETAAPQELIEATANTDGNNILVDDGNGFPHGEGGPAPDQDLSLSEAQLTHEDHISEPVDGGTGLGDDFGFDPLADANEFQAIPQQPADPYSAVKQQDTQRIVPEKILRWREEQQERLATKDRDSEIKQEEWREIAAKELEDWYKHREEQLEKTKSGNREAEAAFVHDRDEKVPGHEWEKVCRLCDFNPKSSRTTKDVARMRSILLQLKQTPLSR